MNSSLIAYLQRTGSYSQEELTLLEEKLEYQTYPKETFLLNKDEVCSSLYFIESGAICQYKEDDAGEKHMIDLNVTHDWVINHKSFTSRKPSEYYIQAYEACEVYILSIEAIHTLIAESQAFFQLGKILEASTARVHFFDNNYTPDEKYAYVLKHKPALVQKFPQTLLASYLKMTPETLSRVRKRIS